MAWVNVLERCSWFLIGQCSPKGQSLLFLTNTKCFNCIQFVSFIKRIAPTEKRYCFLGDPCSRMLTDFFLASHRSLRLRWSRVWCWHPCFRKWLHQLHHLIRNADSSVKSLHVVSLIFYTLYKWGCCFLWLGARMRNIWLAWGRGVVHSQGQQDVTIDSMNTFFLVQNI